MECVDWSTAEAPTYRPMSEQELDAYFSRIGCVIRHPAVADSALLSTIVHSHAFAVPFESLDVTLRTPISIAPRAIFSKLVVARRGGYCLETSFLLLAALQALGFDVRLRSARVWMRTEAYTPREPPNPRLHVVLLVRTPGCSEGDGHVVWLVDVGFGGGSPAAPLPLLDGGVTTVAGEVFRTAAGDVASGEDDWVLWGLRGGAWKCLYSFGHSSWDAPLVHAADFIATNFFVSAAPGSIFHTMRVISLPIAGDKRLTLLNNELRRRDEPEREGGSPTAASIIAIASDAKEYRDLARAHFGIVLSEDQAQIVFKSSCSRY
jgi:arylamine N-acetyltransferase